MADLRVKIQYVPPTGNIDNISIPTRTEEFSGISSSLYIPSIGQHFFQLSDDNNPQNASYGLEEGVFWRGTSAERYNGFVSFTKSNSEGYFENANDVTITFTGLNIDGFAISFDNVAQQWATELTVNGVPYNNEGAIFTWQGDTNSSTTIILKKWNRPNVSARITSITVGLELEYERDRFTLVQRGMQIVEDNTILSWGVLGQYGSLNIIDIDKEIKDLATVGILKSGVRIPITIMLDGNQIASFIGNKWSYAFGNNIVNVELTSDIDKLNNIIYNGYAPQENKTNAEILNELKNLTEQNGIIVRFFDSDTQEYIGRITQRFLTMSQSTLLEAWNRFCNDTFTRFYFNENMELVLTQYV